MATAWEAVKRAGDNLRSVDIVTGVHSVEDIGSGRIMVVFYLNVTDVSGRVRKRVLNSPDDHPLIMDLDKVADAIGKAMMVIGKRVFAKPDGSLHLMQ